MAVARLAAGTVAPYLARQAAPYVSRALVGARLGQMAYRGYNSYKKTTQVKRRTGSARSGGGQNFITAQKDYSSVYKRRPMPKGKKKRWIKKKKQFTFMTLQTRPKSYIVLNRTNLEVVDAAQLALQPTGIQRYLVFNTYSANGIAGGTDGDVMKMFQSQAAAVAPQDADIIYGTGFYNSVTFSNKTETPSEVIIDLYECYWKTDINKTYNGSSYNDLTSMFNAYFTAELTEPAGGIFSAVNGSTFGATPFQASDFARVAKINKKTRVVVGNGSIFNFDYHDTKCRKFNKSINDDLLGYKGTKFYVAVMYSAATNTVNESYTGQFSMRITQTKKITFRSNTDNERTEGVQAT